MKCCRQLGRSDGVLKIKGNPRLTVDSSQQIHRDSCLFSNSLYQHYDSWLKVVQLCRLSTSQSGSPYRPDKAPLLLHPSIHSHHMLLGLRKPTLSYCHFPKTHQGKEPTLCQFPKSQPRALITCLWRTQLRPVHHQH